MSDQYVPALRQRFLEDMRIKGLQPKTQTLYLRGMSDFTLFPGHAPDRRVRSSEIARGVRQRCCPKTALFHPYTQA